MLGVAVAVRPAHQRQAVSFVDRTPVREDAVREFVRRLRRGRYLPITQVEMETNAALVASGQRRLTRGETTAAFTRLLSRDCRGH